MWIDFLFILNRNGTLGGFGMGGWTIVTGAIPPTGLSTILCG